MTKPLTLSEVIDKIDDDRTFVQDEAGSLKMKKDLTRLERVRILLNRWWVFALLILAASQIVQTVIAVLKYFRCP